VAHKAKLLESEGGAFVEHEAPLPVGSPLAVIEEGKEERGARVVHVVEHEAGSGPAGMRLVWDANASLREAITVRVEKPPVEEAPGDVAPDASSADASSDASTDASGDASTDASSDGTVEAVVASGNGSGSGKKSKKNKKRR
jgi:hypothetical protein